MHKHWAILYTTKEPGSKRYSAHLEVRRARRHTDRHPEGRLEVPGHGDTVVVPIDREGQIEWGWNSIEEAFSRDLRPLVISTGWKRLPAERRPKRGRSWEYAVRIELQRRRNAIVKALEDRRQNPKTLDVAVLGMDREGRIHCPNLDATDTPAPSASEPQPPRPA